MREASAPIAGYVVRVDTPGGERAFDSYSVVAEGPDQALKLVRAQVGDEAAASILRPLAQWEVDAFNLVSGEARKYT